MSKKFNIQPWMARNLDIQVTTTTAYPVTDSLTQESILISVLNHQEQEQVLNPSTLAIGDENAAMMQVRLDRV